RWRERPLWSSQQAVRNAREQADVILYLVNAAEDPADAGYVALEMEVLGWIGKPVILLLNQMGPPRAEQGEEVARWRAHLADVAVVRGALPLDAFARCWVQEGALLDTVAPLLDAPKQAAMAALEREWQRRNRQRFEAAMATLAAPLALAASDREPVPDRGLRGQVNDLLRGRSGDPAEVRQAMQRLAERLEGAMTRATDDLIAAHGLSGRASRKVRERLGKDYASAGPTKEGYAAILGGLTSGAVGGLAADLAAGGLMLGGGMIVGAILGALGAGSLARGYNVVRGETGESVGWSEEFCDNLARTLLLRYLAVAHFGRGRGEYEESEHPAFWQDAVSEVMARHGDDLRSLVRSARRGDPAVSAAEATALLRASAQALLLRFYPEGRDVLRPAPAAGRDADDTTAGGA
ncbi:MAG: DUF3482 domain-containing protein, partial [Novosphingobium sp.]